MDLIPGVILIVLVGAMTVTRILLGGGVGQSIAIGASAAVAGYMLRLAVRLMDRK